MSAKIAKLQKALRQFADERDWGQFHSPKNLAAALSVEAGELLEHFQWMSEEESRNLPPGKRRSIAKESADVFIYLLQLADRLEFDLVESAREKLVENGVKYPVELARGNSRKYDELQDDGP